MAAFAYGFRDALEAAFIIGLAFAALIRLGRGPIAQAQLTQALWIGTGAGALLGFSIGTGLAAANLAATGTGWMAFEIASIALSLVALGGLLLSARCLSADSGPCLWLAAGVGFFAAVPQALDMTTAMANNQAGLSGLALMAAGALAAIGLAGLISLGLIRLKLPQRGADPSQPVSGELAPVRQRAD